MQKRHENFIQATFHNKFLFKTLLFECIYNVLSVGNINKLSGNGYMKFVIHISRYMYDF